MLYHISVMGERTSRTELLICPEGIRRLAESRVAVFGVGGVGGYVVEALARSGVGQLDLIDGDTVAESNINRQIIADYSTIGRSKTEVFKDRIAGIGPECIVNTYPLVFSEKTCGAFDFSKYSYVVDAIDDVPAKLLIIKMAEEAGVPVISSMGAGNKMDPMAFEVADIYKTSVCPLAKAVRKGCRDLGIKKLKTVYSRELPVRPAVDGARVPASIAFVPPAAGLLIASEVVKDLIGWNGRQL